jgi:thymidine kinase
MNSPDSHRFDPPGKPAAPAVGWIEVVCGSMFSGKTEELLRRIKRARLARQRVLLFKPRIDNRYDAVKVVSHEGVNADAVPVSTAAEILERVLPGTAVVGIDEVQFFDDAIVGAAESLATRGVRVIAAGTRSQRLVAAEGQLFVGGSAEYESRCRACFVPEQVLP